MRVRKLNDAAVRTPAGYVLYWSQMIRRVESNHALSYSVAFANQLVLPLLLYEGPACAYPNASGYVFYLRWRRSDPDDVLCQLAGDAGAIVTDDYPTFSAAWHNARVPVKIGVAYFVVDGNRIVPMNCLNMSHEGMRQKVDVAGYIREIDQ